MAQTSSGSGPTPGDPTPQRIPVMQRVLDNPFLLLLPLSLRAILTVPPVVSYRA